MLNTNEKVIKHKGGLLNLAEELGNVSFPLFITLQREGPPASE